MEMWLNAAGEYGMTAVIAFYLLHRMEKKLDILIDTVQSRPESFAAATVPSNEENEKSYHSIHTP